MALIPSFMTRNTCADALSDRELVMEFSNLGDNTEFGFIQRACGAEPLGLMRFNTSSIGNLCDALETRLAHLYVDGDLRSAKSDEPDLYFFSSKHYQDFTYWAFATDLRGREVEILEREQRKVALLKRQLLEDLASGEKIFIRRGSDALGELRRLHRALRSYGPNVLLIVAMADADHPAGTLERLDTGLLRGFVKEFKICSRPEPFDVASWLTVCREAHRMVRPPKRYARSTTLGKGHVWSLTKPDRVALSRADGLDRRDAVRLETGGPRHAAELLASCRWSVRELTPRAPVLFSAWVRVAHDFSGSEVAARFDGPAAMHIHPYDLKQRGRWQRVWATVQLPRGTETLVGAIRALADPGQTIDIAEWAFAKGTVPTPPPRGARPTIAGRWSRGRRAAMLRRLRKRWSGAPGHSTPHDAYVHWGEILIARGAFVEADEVLAEALLAFPDDPRLLKLYATSAHNQGRYGGAIQRWTRGVTVDPNDPMCFAGFASNLREHGSLFRASDVMSSALARFPDEMVVLTEAARLAEATNRPADAFKLYAKAIALHGSHPEWLAGRDSARRRCEHAGQTVDAFA